MAENGEKDYVRLTRQELRDVCEKSAEEAINRVLPQFGIDPKDPFEMQRDFLHVRKWRKATESATTMTFRTVIAILVTGSAGAFWVGLKAYLGK